MYSMTADSATAHDDAARNFLSLSAAGVGQPRQLRHCRTLFKFPVLSVFYSQFFCALQLEAA